MITQQRPYILEAKTQSFIDALSAQGGKPIYELSYEEARKVLEDAQGATSRRCPPRSKKRCCRWARRDRCQFASIVQRAPRPPCRS